MTSAPTIHPEPSPLSEDQRRQGQRRIIRCSVVSVLFMVGLSDRVISLFILGVSPTVSASTLAFFFALGPLTAVLTALMSPMVELRGKKRILIPFYLANPPFILLLVAIPLFCGSIPPGAVVAATACVLAAYAATRSLGFAGWFPIINDNVPDEGRGRFFGRLRTSWQLMVVVYTALVGWFLGHRPEPWQFQAVFAVAALANLAMTAGILRIPEAPLTPPRRDMAFWRMLAEPFHDPPYVRFLAFGVCFNLAAAMAGPFALRCLKGTLGAGDGFVVWMDTLGSIGAVATLPLWGRAVDRFGGRTIFTFLLPPLAALNLVWLLADPSDAIWRMLVGGFYLFQGSLLFGVGVGITDMMLGSAREGHRSAYINIAFVLNTLAVGLGPFAGTAIAAALSPFHSHWGALTLDANRWVFLGRFALMLLPLWLVPRLSREHGGRVGEAVQRLTAGLLNLLPSTRR